MAHDEARTVGAADGDLDRWRELALERLHHWGAVVALAVSILVGLGGGVDLLTTLALAPVLAIPLLYGFRRRMSARARAASFAAAMFCVAALNFALVGFSPNFSLVVVLAALALAVWFGPRTTIIFALVAIATVWIAAVVRITTGWSPPLHHVLHHDPMNLLRLSAAYTVLSLLVIGSIAYAIALVDRHAHERAAALTRLRAETEQLAAAEAARRTAEQALVQSQKLELVGRVASGVAHDFNNALTVILTWAEILRRTGRDSAAGLEAIRRAALSSAQMTRRLLVFGRHSAFEKMPVFIAHHLEETARTLERVLPEHITVQIDCDDVPPVAADPGALDQALLNLALNARDAMPDGGTLRIRALRGTSAETGLVGIAVADDGVGMDETTQARIFEPFFTTKGDRGTGLGLPSVRAIVEEFGGRVDVASQVGQGTTITLWLPESTRAPIAAETERDSSVVRRATILVVEDDPALRQVMAAALRDVGHEVHEAGSVDAGLEIARRMRGEIAVLCTDAIMPGGGLRRLVDGFRELYPAAAVLLCSGYLAPEVPTAEELGASFLAKPFAATDLVREVDELIAGGPRTHR